MSTPAGVDPHLFLVVEIARLITVLIGSLTIGRLGASLRRANRLQRTPLRQHMTVTMIWLVSGLWVSAAYGILTHAHPGPGWIFFPISWVGYVLAMRLVNDVEQIDQDAIADAADKRVPS